MKIGKLIHWALGIVAAMWTVHVWSAAPQDTGVAHKAPYKILHIMSYHSPWRWTDGQLEGFKEGMADAPVEYQVFQMDTKRNSTPEAKDKKGQEARALIESWRPDLVYTSDDDAQQYVTTHYVNQELPFVFSGINKDPKIYQFVGSKNITGVLEQEHIVETVNLLRQIAPGVKRIAVVLDNDTMWEPVMARMREQIAQIPGVEIVAWDRLQTFDEYQRKIKEYPSQADAIALIGIFNFKDAQGKNVPYQEVLRWTAENSPLPDCSFWIDRVYYGTLAAVTVSEREQGLAAGRLARAILVEGRSPSSLPMQPTVKGHALISLARANKLGIKIKSGVLLSAEVIEKFEWDK
ncbi:MAG: ABC transporter substrate binding protein [Candidatus Competibacteraceae bacterium]